MKRLTDAQKENGLYILAGVCFLLPGIEVVPYLADFLKGTWYQNYYHNYWLFRYALPVIGYALLSIGSFFNKPFPLAAAGYSLLAAAQVNLFIACWIVGINTPFFGLSNALELAGSVCAVMLIASRHSPQKAWPHWTRDDWYVPVILFGVSVLLYTIVRTPALIRTVLIYGEMRYELELEETLLQYCSQTILSFSLRFLLPLLGSYCLLRPPASGMRKDRP